MVLEVVSDQAKKIALSNNQQIEIKHNSNANVCTGCWRPLVRESRNKIIHWSRFSRWQIVRREDQDRPWLLTTQTENIIKYGSVSLLPLVG